MQKSVEQYKERLRAAGITPDKPLYEVLLSTYEATLETRAIIGTGARGLTEQGERELIERIAMNAVDVTGQEIERLARKISFRTAALFGLVGLGR